MTTLPRARALSQSELRAAWRNESCLDHRIKLGFPVMGHPETGRTITRYYAEKHRPGGPGRGKYWPLHETETAWGRKAS